MTLTEVMNMQGDRLMLRPAEAAAVIGMSRARAYQLIAAGELPSVLVGGSIRVPVVALNAWIEERLSERRRARQDERQLEHVNA